MESVILMKFGELSYFSNFFDFDNVFGDIHPFGLGPEVKGKLEEIRSLLETLGGTLYPRKNKTYQNHIRTTTFVTKNILCDPPY